MFKPFQHEVFNDPSIPNENAHYVGQEALNYYSTQINPPHAYTSSTQVPYQPQLQATPTQFFPNGLPHMVN